VTAIAISLFGCCVVVCGAGLLVVRLGIAAKRQNKAHESVIELEERISRLEAWRGQSDLKKMMGAR